MLLLSLLGPCLRGGTPARQAPLVICGGATATPVDRTGDPQLAQWAQVDLTSEGYFPPEIPGKWDCSAAREVGPLSGEVRFRVSHGCLAASINPSVV